MTTYGYARVSPNGETLDAQVEALKAVGCEKIFREKVSGAGAGRAELAKLLAKLGAGDVLIVCRLDRLARSTRGLVNVIDALGKQGATFRSLGDQWADTTTRHGRLVLTVLGGLAEFERELIRARSREGRERARARGQNMGRPPCLTPHQQAEARKALASGAASQVDLARRFAVSQSTISRLAGKSVAPPAPPSRAIDTETEHAARIFMNRLEGKYPVTKLILYGSRARGDHRPDSDADIAVILKGNRGDRAKAAVDFAGIEFHVLMETGVMVQGLPLWEGELARPETFANPALIENILREGVRL